ncbi:MAG: type II toxin-antitoxin system ParD family antitoxin [bacterium]|nr:type II toxin-antitoxin system ParD family antitoxin [bacterium]
MNTVKELRVALPTDLIAMLDSAVETGEYASSSEIIHEALWNWKLKRKAESLEIDELRKLIQDGINSGPSVDAEHVFSRLREKYEPSAK